MYIPKNFEMTDLHEVLSFMQRYSFATLVSVQNGMPVAAHLPFVIKTADRKDITLLAHFAKNNPQTENIAGQEVLVIFAEPHAYISPSNYEKLQNVPTWNYVAVHAYGKVNLIDDIEKASLLLEETINTFEASYLNQWQGLPADYKQKMLKGITAFEMEITRVEGKKKLSQNRSEVEKISIINQLKDSPSTTERDIAAYMDQTNA